MKILNTIIEARCGANELAYTLKEYLGKMGTEVDMLTQRFMSKDCHLNGGDFTHIDNLAKNLQDYDIVHVHTPLAADRINKVDIIDRILEASDDPKVVYHLHLLEYDLLRRLWKENEAKNDYHVKAQEEMMKISDTIVHPSEWQRKVTEELYPRFSEKYCVIPNGSDFYKYANDSEVNEMKRNLRTTLNSDGGHKTVLYAGRVTPEKGVISLAKACKNLERNHNHKISLVYRGPYNKETENEIIKNAPSRTILINGNADSQKLRAAWYKASDVVCVPTYFESFCIVALESLMLGIPTVISYIDAPKELFVDTGWAIGTMPGNIKMLENAIDGVLTGRDDKEVKQFPEIPPLLKRLGIDENEKNLRAKIAQKAVSQKYDIRKVAQLWLKKYESLLS